MGKGKNLNKKPEYEQKGSFVSKIMNKTKNLKKKKKKRTLVKRNSFVSKVMNKN